MNRDVVDTRCRKGKEDPRVSIAANQELVALRRTPFYARVLSLNETMTWFAWGDFLVAHEFTSVDREIEALRTRVVVADQTPLYQLRVSGPTRSPSVRRA
jgi:glycine cleavage system aminomethyltransferase T